MALIGTNRGVSSNGTGALTVVITPGANFTAGSFAVLALSYDNSGSGGSDPYVSITDSVGNVWTSRANVLNDPGAANAGSVLRIFTSTITTLTTGNTITVTFGSSTTNKTWSLTEFTSNTPGGTPAFLLSATAAGSNTTPTITSSSITSGDVIFGAMGNEGNATVTADSDTTNGTWSTQQTTSVGTGTGGMEVASQYKITTGTGAQTYNLTLSATGDWSIGWISITEIVATSFDPFGMLGFFGM